LAPGIDEEEAEELKDALLDAVVEVQQLLQETTPLADPRCVYVGVCVRVCMCERVCVHVCPSLNIMLAEPLFVACIGPMRALAHKCNLTRVHMCVCVHNAHTHTPVHCECSITALLPLAALSCLVCLGWHPHTASFAPIFD